MKSVITLSLISSVVANNIAHKVNADDVIAALTAGTAKQEENIKTTTEKLRALQKRVEAIFPHTST
jgi:uncharacterized coiled-coil protein SlyX